MTQRTPNPDEFLQSTAFMDAIRRIARDEARALIEVETGIEPNTPHEAVVFDPYGRAIGGAAGGGGSVTRVAFQVGQSSAQSIPNATWTGVTFNDAVFDDTGVHPGLWASHPNRISKPANTAWNLGFWMDWGSGAPGLRAVRAAPSTSFQPTIGDHRWLDGSGGWYETYTWSATWYDFNFLDIQVYQDTGGAVNMQMYIFGTKLYDI